MSKARMTMGVEDVKLSENFWLHEFLESITAAQQGIINKPSPQQIDNLKILCECLLQRVRVIYGKPITITSGFRNGALNRAVGGAYNSAHMHGYAADLQGVTLADNKVLFDIISKLDYDKLIWEYGNDSRPQWVHVSFKLKGNRHLRMRKESGKDYYVI